MNCVRRGGIRIFLTALLTALLMQLGPAAAVAADTPVLSLRASGDFATRADLQLKATALTTMTPIPFRLVIRDAAGYPIEGAQVFCDLTMPAMSMPKNQPKVTEKNGVYRGEMIFTMAGAWRATFEFTPRSGSPGKVVFDLGKVFLK